MLLLTIEDIEPLHFELLVPAHGVPFTEQVVDDILDVFFELENVFLPTPVDVTINMIDKGRGRGQGQVERKHRCKTTPRLFNSNVASIWGLT
jgi:hypothetical protein